MVYSKNITFQYNFPAQVSTMAEEDQVRAIFNSFDANGDKLISYDELEKVFGRIGGYATKEDLRSIIESVSTDYYISNISL